MQTAGLHPEGWCEPAASGAGKKMSAGPLQPVLRVAGRTHHGVIEGRGMFQVRLRQPEGV